MFRSLILFFLFLVTASAYSSERLFNDENLEKNLHVVMKVENGIEISANYLGDKKPTHFFNLDLVAFRDTKWTNEEILTEMKVTAEAYAKCGISLNKIRIFHTDAYKKTSDFSAESTLEFLNSTIRMLSTPRVYYVHTQELVGTTDIAATVMVVQGSGNDEVLQKIFKEHSDDIMKKYGLSNKTMSEILTTRKRELYYPSLSAKMNTIWIQEKAINRDVRRTTAHELAHLFSGQSHNYSYENLLNRSEAIPGIQLTPSQCELIKGSPYIFPIIQ